MLPIGSRHRVETSEFLVEHRSVQHDTHTVRKLEYDKAIVSLGLPATVDLMLNGIPETRRFIPADISLLPRGTELLLKSPIDSEVLLVAFKRWPPALAFPLQLGIRDSQIQGISYALREELDRGLPTGEAYITQLCTALSLYISSGSAGLGNNGAGLPLYRLRRVLDHIHTHLARNMELPELSSVIGMSSQNFANLFRQSTGMSPHQYIVAERIERAKQLLLRTQLTLAEVALEAGFASQSHMTETFRRLTSKTPKRYQQEMATGAAEPMPRSKARLAH